MAKAREVWGRFRTAGLHLYIRKCEFGVKEVKYLWFVVEAGRAIRPDPVKLRRFVGGNRRRGWRVHLRIFRISSGHIE